MKDHKRHSSPSLLGGEDNKIAKKKYCVSNLLQSGEQTTCSNAKNIEETQSGFIVKTGNLVSNSSRQVKFNSFSNLFMNLMI